MYSGESLYSWYASLQVNLNSCGCDPWDLLPHSDQKVWNKMAEELSNTLEKSQSETSRLRYPDTTGQ